MAAQTKTSTQRNNLGYFNLARGLMLVMIIYGHSYSAVHTAGAVSPEVTDMWNFGTTGLFAGAGSVVGGGLMAMMLMMSGYSFFKRSPKKCMKIQKKLLIDPYILLGIAVILSKALLAVLEHRSFWEHGGEYILTYLLALNYEGGGTILGIPVQSINIFWFIWALFVGWNVYNAIQQQKEEKVRLVMVVLCVLAGWFLTMLSRVWPFCISIGLISVGYLAAGKMIRQYDLLNQSPKPWQWVLIGLVSVICLAFGGVNIVYGYWLLGPVDILGSICLGYVFLRLYGFLMDHIFHGKIVALFERVGISAMWVISLHAYEKMILPWYRVRYFLPEFPGIVLVFVLRCLVIFILYKILTIISKKYKKQWKQLKKNRRFSNAG